MEQGRKEKLILEHRKFRDDDESVDASERAVRTNKIITVATLSFILLIFTSECNRRNSKHSFQINIIPLEPTCLRITFIAVDLNSRSNMQRYYLYHNQPLVSFLP
jgi:hypothetical protein